MEIYMKKKKKSLQTNKPLVRLCTLNYKTESKGRQITLGPLQIPLLLPSSTLAVSTSALPPLPAPLHSRPWLTFKANHHFILKEKFEKLEEILRRWIHLDNYANQTGDEAFINVREVLHQIVLEFIKLL